MSIQTGVRVRKRLSWVLTSVTLTFDLWPWPFAWTSLLSMVMTPGNFMMIPWWEHGENIVNKANLRDLIAATGLVILFKLDLNRWFFSPCDLKIWWMTPTRQIWGIWKLRLAYSPETPNLGKIGDVLSRVTLKFDGWPWKTIGHLPFAVSSFVQHFIAIGELKLELQSGNAQFGSNSTNFRAMWPWNLTDDLERQ